MSLARYLKYCLHMIACDVFHELWPLLYLMLLLLACLLLKNSKSKSISM